MAECTALCNDIEQDRDLLLAENERLREGVRELADWLIPHNAKAAQKALDLLDEDYATTSEVGI